MVRTMRFIIVFKYIGPKILALKHMVFDVVSFFTLFAIFSLTYGTVTQSFLYPNEWRWDTLLRGIFFKSYFHIFGELFAEETSIYIGEDHPEAGVECDPAISKDIFNSSSGFSNFQVKQTWSNRKSY